MEKLQAQVQEIERNEIKEIPERRPAEQIEKIQNKLERLGFKKAVSQMDKIQRMSVAYEQYMFVTQDKVNAFNEKLRKETIEEDKIAYTFKKLIFTPIEEYGKVPPDSVLDKLEKAQATKIFDRFEIGHIEWIKEIKDPIIFGRIDGCEDRFFISQWDDDVKIEDIIFTK